MPRNLLLLLSRLLLPPVRSVRLPCACRHYRHVRLFAGLPATADTRRLGHRLFELVAGLLILVGFQTRSRRCCLLPLHSAGFIGHYGQGGDDPMLTFLHGHADEGHRDCRRFLALAMVGAGAWSIDGRIWRRVQVT